MMGVTLPPCCWSSASAACRACCACCTACNQQRAHQQYTDLENCKLIAAQCVLRWHLPNVLLCALF